MKPFQMVAACLFYGLAAAQTGPAPVDPGFEVFRLRSGMTPEEISRKFPTYELRWLAQPSGAAMLVRHPVNLENPDIYASISFCQNRLVSVIRNIDPDTEFLGYVQDYIRECGQPQVNIRKEPWTGLNGGDITTLELIWTRDGVRRLLSLIPEGRTGSGELRYVRTASVMADIEKHPIPCK
jgi:hypothetical protein